MLEDQNSELPESLARAQTEPEFHHAYQAELQSFDALNSRTIAERGARLDCCAGCSLCCASLRVDVYAHEVFLIARHVRSHFTEPEINGLMERLAAHSATVLQLTPFEHATKNIACPLLQNGRCSVYEARPQACRRHHSLDVRACQATFDDPANLDLPGAPDRPLFRTLTEAMQQGAGVYAQLGYDTTIYELGTALEEALTDPESWTSWRNHMEAFVRASVTPAS